MHRYAQLPQRAVMQSASLSRHFILPVVILARWWFKTLEVVAASVENTIPVRGDNGRKEKKEKDRWEDTQE